MTPTPNPNPTPAPTPTPTPAITPGRAAPAVLITAGPTHEPIDAVRYIANRSSGRLGLALADAALARGCPTTLLLGPGIDPSEHGTGPTNAGTRPKPGPNPGSNSGPNPGQPPDSSATVRRFRTSHDLLALLKEEAPRCDALVMAAAVADYRPSDPRPGKLTRTEQPLAITLEPVPDLLAMATGLLKPGAVAIGFALEEDAGDQPSGGRARALAKMARKGCHAIVLNPLATMDSGHIEATILFADGRPAIAPGPLTKAGFAHRLIDATLDLLTTTRGTP